MGTQITSYTTLSNAIASWAERSDLDADELIGLAEADFRLYLGPNYAKEASATITFDTGSAALPAGFIRPISMVHATYGPVTLKTIGAVRERRVVDSSGVPDIYAVTGSTLEIAPSYDGDVTFDYEGTLQGLATGNPTNWLLLAAPQAYLAMCQSYAKAKTEDWQSAALLRQTALATLSDLGIQSMVGQIGSGAVNIPGPTP